MTTTRPTADQATQHVEPETAPGAAHGRRRKHETRDAYLFLAPYLVLFLAFVIGPFVYGLWISLHQYDYSLPEKPFVGLDNYTGLLDGTSPYAQPFWDSMKATWIFTVLSVPLLLVLPLLVAMVMNAKFRGRNFFRAMYFAPYVLGVAVVAVLWRYLLDSNIGLVNHYLGVLGLPSDTAWLTTNPGHGSRWSGSPCGGRSGSTRSSISLRSARSRPTSTRPLAWTAPTDGSGSCT